MIWSRMNAGFPLSRRVYPAAAVLLAHVVLLAALVSIRAAHPAALIDAAITVALVSPRAPVPAVEPTRPATPEAPDLVPVQFTPSPIEIPAIAPPSAPASAETPVVVTVARVAETPSPPPTIESVSYVREPDVRYPPLSRRLKEQGLVVVRVLIGADGRAADVQVQRSSGYARLDAAACEAVRRAEFRPYVVAGRALVASALVPIEFSLAS